MVFLKIKIMKDEIVKAAVLVTQQKTGAATIAGGLSATVTPFIDGITPYVPVASLSLMFIFGAANLYINWKRKK